MKSNEYQKELDLILKEEELIEIENKIDKEGITDESIKKSKRLFCLRKSHKLSRRLLEEETGVSQSTIKKYETGGMIAQGGTLSTIADYFNLPLSYFIAPDDLMDTDMQLISSLRFYSWLLSVKHNSLDSTFSNGATLDENSRLYSKETIVLSAITACNIAISCLPDSNDNIASCYYIANCLSMHGFDDDLQHNLNNGNPVFKLKKFFNEKLTNYSNKIIQDANIPKDVSIDYLLRIIEFLVCNRRVVDKRHFNMIVQQLKPLIEIYKLYLSRKLTPNDQRSSENHVGR